MQGKDTDPKKDMLLVRRQWANGSLWATRKVWRTFTVVAKGPLQTEARSGQVHLLYHTCGQQHHDRKLEDQV